MKDKKEKKPLNPVVIDNTDNSKTDLEKIKSIMGDSSILDIKKESNLDESDNFFRSVVNQMLNKENISLKTEYLNQNENFASAKLEFLARYGNMPYLSDFIAILETKRVSLNRKSRIELIKAFERRDEEIQAQTRLNNIKQMFGVN